MMKFWQKREQKAPISPSNFKSTYTLAERVEKR